MFGKINSKEGFNFNHTKVTVWDNVMNYGCGSLQILLVLIGVPLNIFLYHFHWQKRVSWTARFYRFLAVANLGLVLLESLPQAIYLLMPWHLQESQKGLEVFNEILELGSEWLWSYHKLVIFMLCLMQYLYIHHPYWSIFYGVKFKKLMMGALVFLIFFLTVAFILSLSVAKNKIFAFSNVFEIFYAKDETATVLMIILVQVPDYLFIFSSLVLYVITRRNLRWNTEIEITDKIRSDFSVIGKMVANVFLWMLIKISNSAFIFSYPDLKIIPYGYFYFNYTLSNVLDSFFATLTSIYVLTGYNDVKVAFLNLLKTRERGSISYEQL